jgi:hypothetical protein
LCLKSQADRMRLAQETIINEVTRLWHKGHYLSSTNDNDNLEA